MLGDVVMHGDADGHKANHQQRPPERSHVRRFQEPIRRQSQLQRVERIRFFGHAEELLAMPKNLCGTFKGESYWRRRRSNLRYSLLSTNVVSSWPY